MASNFAETITSDGTVQFVVWVRANDGSVFPVAHGCEAAAIATLTALLADPSLGVAVPPPASN